MIYLYVYPSCTSCRQARQWLKNHQLQFIEYNLKTCSLEHEVLEKILSLTENGVADIISPRKFVIKGKVFNPDKMTLNKLYETIREFPYILKRPIIMDDNYLQVGYNEEDIRTFLTREIRHLEISELTRKSRNSNN